MWRWNLGLLLEGISGHSIKLHNVTHTTCLHSYKRQKDEWNFPIQTTKHLLNETQSKFSSNWVWNVSVELNQIPFVIKNYQIRFLHFMISWSNKFSIILNMIPSTIIYFFHFFNAQTSIFCTCNFLCSRISFIL